MHRAPALVVAALLVASCGSTPQASPGTARSPVPTSSTPSATPAGNATPAPTATDGGDPASFTTGDWVDAGDMALGRHTPHAVLVGDGSVLVVGNDELGCVRADSAFAETWDPVGNRWAAAHALNKARAEFVAVGLLDGRALVTGGVNAGSEDELSGDAHQAFSSTYLYDPQGDAWTRGGQLGTARVAPAAAVLPDGRVLVAGGVYLDSRVGVAAPAGGVTLAAWQPEPGAGQPLLDDVAPPQLIPVLATAELYDPATDSWTETGSMRVARLGAPAVTLADGRVLVVGSRRGSDWNYTRAGVPDRAFTTAEIYDPGTGRFTLTGAMPDMDWSAVADVRPNVSMGTGGIWTIDPQGSLVALADGGALWIDTPVEWYAGTDEDPFEGRSLRTLRLDGTTGEWTVIDQHVWVHSAKGETPDPMREVVPGHTRDGALVARLADGKVLVAGGLDGVTIKPSTAADLYDPGTNTWSTLPPMPEPRANGAAVVLSDGSVLLVGGDGVFDECALESCECGEGTTGVDSSARFVPRP